MQNTLCLNAIVRWATDEQKKRYLPKLAKDTIGSYALSEASSGSDAFALKTRARREGDYYVLNGQKLWITNAYESGIFIVFRDARSISWIQGYYSRCTRKGNTWVLGRQERRQTGHSGFQHL